MGVLPRGTMPAPLLPPIPLDLLPELLRRRGVTVSDSYVAKAAAAGALPVWREGGRHFVDQADLETVEAYFRAHPARPYHKGAAALDRVRKG
jgi:hypothetical protein